MKSEEFAEYAHVMRKIQGMLEKNFLAEPTAFVKDEHTIIYKKKVLPLEITLPDKLVNKYLKSGKEA